MVYECSVCGRETKSRHAVKGDGSMFRLVDRFRDYSKSVCGAIFLSSSYALTFSTPAVILHFNLGSFLSSAVRHSEERQRVKGILIRAADAEFDVPGKCCRTCRRIESCYREASERREFIHAAARVRGV
jgi:hypothetical protein